MNNLEVNSETMDTMCRQNQEMSQKFYTFIAVTVNENSSTNYR